MITLHVGGPAVFVLSWALVKVFSVESSNIDGVSMNILICIVYMVPLWYCMGLFENFLTCLKLDTMYHICGAK